MPRWIAIFPVVYLFLAGGCPSADNVDIISGPDSSVGGTTAGAATATDDGLVSPAREVPACSEPTSVESLRARIFDLVNRERASYGLDPLTRNSTLQNQASDYACELIEYDYFAHVNPVTQSTLRDRSGRFGYAYQVIGENLAAGQTTPERAFADWLESPSHRDNILDPRFTELGIGIKLGGDYGIYWVQEFGLPAE
jgi:uncharacterized protein YkwD